jgi:DNA repair photolyase
MTMRILNKGNGFISAYDWTVSGLSVTRGCAFGCLYCYSPTIIHMSLPDFKDGGKPLLVSLEVWRAEVEKQAPRVAGKSVYVNNCPVNEAACNRHSRQA